MQKYILSLIILIFSSQIFSQELSFSVVVDPMITWMKTNDQDIQRDGYNFGYNIGLVMDKYFTDSYALSSGLSILLRTTLLLCFSLCRFINIFRGSLPFSIKVI